VCTASSNLCLSACGHKEQPCCHSPASDTPPTHAGTGPGWCYAGDTCVGDTCSCGGPNQACCLSGSPCAAGLSCLDLLCRKAQSGTSCAQCAANLTTCQKGCATDPAHQAQCDCLCSNTACDCEKTAGCVLTCQLRSCVGP
jgi:hypothetical protein